MQIIAKREVNFACVYWDGSTFLPKENKWRINITASSQAYEKAVLSFQAAVDYMQVWLDKYMTNRIICNELVFNQIPEAALIFPTFVTPLNSTVLVYFVEEMQRLYCDEFGFEITEIEVL